MKLKFLFVSVLVVMFVGCNSKTDVEYKFVSIDANVSIDKNIIDAKSLQNRFCQYWEYAAASDFKNAYNFELPYLNFLKPLDEYLMFKGRNKKHFNTTMFAIKADKLDPTIAYVKMQLKSETINSKIIDKWLNINGIWYHSYYPSILPPPPPRIKSE